MEAKLGTGYWDFGIGCWLFGIGDKYQTKKQIPFVDISIATNARILHE